jgi:hypothetical protein
VKAETLPHTAVAAKSVVESFIFLEGDDNSQASLLLEADMDLYETITLTTKSTKCKLLIVIVKARLFQLSTHITQTQATGADHGIGEHLPLSIVVSLIISTG